MDEIKKWLKSEDKDYNEGIQLLGKAGHHNRALLNNLARKENNQNREKLEYEMQKMLDNAPKKKKEKNPPVMTVPPADPDLVAQLGGKAQFLQKNLAALEPESEEFAENSEEYNKVKSDLRNATGTKNEELDAMDRELTTIFNAKCQLSNTLADQATDEDRKLVVDDILRIKAKYNSLAQKRKYFEENGKHEETTAPALPPTETREQIKDYLRNKLGPKVSKLKKKVEKDPENVEKRTDLAKLELEKQSLEDKLKLMEDEIK